MNNRNKQQGFTLIELLVVVSILASLAGLTSVAMDGYQTDSEETITRVEMQRISNAIRRFKADTGYWPKTETALPIYSSEDKANFSFLFNSPDNVPEWDIEYAIGWHGPYINLDAIKTIITDEYNTPTPNGCADSSDYPDISVINGLATDDKRMNGLVDRFEKVRQSSSGKVKEAAYEFCVLTKRRTKNIDDDGNVIWLWDIEDISASPYLYEEDYFQAKTSTKDGNSLCPDSSNKCVAIRSFGPDGKDDKGIDSSDDIVFVLQQNP
jgi:prepilin-type N-terminal cleavage/methylation domain-containing protein